jgi:hypothetical protein
MNLVNMALELRDKAARERISSFGSVEEKDPYIARMWSGLVFDLDRCRFGYGGEQPPLCA